MFKKMNKISESGREGERESERETERDLVRHGGVQERIVMATR